jgi:hypothetical protein
MFEILGYNREVKYYFILNILFFRELIIAVLST